MKKFFSLVITIAVCLTMGATVFAAGSPVATPIPEEDPITTVTVDDVVITPDDIIENPDGTVTLTDEVISRLNLEEGTHTVVITYSNGVTRTYLVLIASREHNSDDDLTPVTSATPEVAPQTSDLFVVPGLAVIALAGTTTAVVAKKKQ